MPGTRARSCRRAAMSSGAAASRTPTRPPRATAAGTPNGGGEPRAGGGGGGRLGALQGGGRSVGVLHVQRVAVLPVRLGGGAEARGRWGGHGLRGHRGGGAGGGGDAVAGGARG